MEKFLSEFAGNRSSVPDYRHGRSVISGAWGHIPGSLLCGEYPVVVERGASGEMGGRVTAGIDNGEGE